MDRYCVKCGHKFESVGREVICPACKAQAAEESKKAAVLRAKRASWTGESVPVRISGCASTVIREFGKANNLSFAESLDNLLQSTGFFEKLGVEWNTIQPYKSRRRDKHATETARDTQDAPQAGKPQEAPQTAQAAKKAAKTSKAAGKAGKKA